MIGSDITYSCNEDKYGLCFTLRSLLQSGDARRCIIAHEHRRADMFDVDAIVANKPMDTTKWEARDNCLNTFLEAADEAGLLITPLVFEPGSRV